MNHFEKEKFYKHKVSDVIYYCVGFTPRWQPVIMSTNDYGMNEENTPFIVSPSGYGFYEIL